MCCRTIWDHSGQLNSKMRCHRARLARDASAMYPMAIKKLQCHTQHEYRVIRHEADLMQAMSKAGLECIPKLYESCWNREEDAAYLVMQ